MLPSLGDKTIKGMSAYNTIMNLAATEHRPEAEQMGHDLQAMFSNFTTQQLNATVRDALRSQPYRYNEPGKDDIFIMRELARKVKNWGDLVPDELRVSYTDIYAATQGRTFHVVAPPRFVTTLLIDSHTVRYIDLEETYPIWNPYLVDHLKTTYADAWNSIEDEVVLDKKLEREEAERRANEAQAKAAKKKSLGAIFSTPPASPSKKDSLASIFSSPKQTVTASPVKSTPLKTSSRPPARPPCPSGQTRDKVTKECRDKKVASPKRSPCPPGQTRDKITKECRHRKATSPKRSPCPPGQTRDKVTKACRPFKKPSPKKASPKKASPAKKTKLPFAPLSAMPPMAAIQPLVGAAPAGVPVVHATPLAMATAKPKKKSPSKKGPGFATPEEALQQAVRQRFLQKGYKDLADKYNRKPKPRSPGGRRPGVVIRD